MTIGKPREQRSDQATDSTKSNLPLLLIATAFLAVTIVLVIWQPGATSHQTAQAPAPAPIATTTTAVATPSSAKPRTPQVQITGAAPSGADSYVTRTHTPLLSVRFIANETVTSETIITELRQPIRLVNMGTPKRDLPTLTEDILMLMSPNQTSVSPAIKTMLVQAINERQSDGYIRELVNAAVKRGEVTIPPALKTTEGTMDTYSLLKAMAQSANTATPNPLAGVETNGTQKIVPGDSLARLALRYYGKPLKFDIILAANPQINPLDPVLTPGDEIQMPKP